MFNIYVYSYICRTNKHPNKSGNNKIREEYRFLNRILIHTGFDVYFFFGRKASAHLPIKLDKNNGFESWRWTPKSSTMTTQTLFVYPPAHIHTHTHTHHPHQREKIFFARTIVFASHQNYFVFCLPFFAEAPKSTVVCGRVFNSALQLPNRIHIEGIKLCLRM